MSFMSLLMFDFGIFNYVSFWMECSCMAPLTPPVIVIMGLVFQPLFWMVLSSGSYLACFCEMACSGNLSWQYVNSMNCIVWLGDGDIGSVIWLEDPIMHRMSGLSLAWHWHGCCWHMHCSSQSGTVCSCRQLLRWPALIMVRNLVFLLACSVWVIRCIALLCLAILSPVRYVCSHVDNKWAACLGHSYDIVCNWGFGLTCTPKIPNTHLLLGFPSLSESTLCGSLSYGPAPSYTKYVD